MRVLVKKSGKTTHGNKQVKAILTESAWGASRTKETFLSSKYRKLVGRRGKKRAIVAVAHTILIIEELGAEIPENKSA